MAELTDRGRLFQRAGAQEGKALAPVLVLALDKLIPLLDLCKWNGSDGQAFSEDKQAAFHEAFCRSTNLSRKVFEILLAAYEGNEAVKHCE